MSALHDVMVQVRSKNIERSCASLKELILDEELDGRQSLKLIRTLAAQLRSLSNKEDIQHIQEFLTLCCKVLRESSNLATDETEFVQGVLGLFHLMVFSIDHPDIINLVSGTTLYCLRQFGKSVKEVESIAANYYNHLWNASRKVKSKHAQIYQSYSLQVFVYSDPTNWNRVADRLIAATHEVAAFSLQLTGEVFEEFSSLFKQRKCCGLLPASILLQIWTRLVFQAKSKSHYEDQIPVIKATLKDAALWKTFKNIIDIVMNVAGVQSKNINVNWESCGNELDVVLVRIVNLALHYGNVILRKSVKTNDCNQISSIQQILILFYERIDSLKHVIENRLKPDEVQLKIICITQALSLHVCLLEVSSSHLDQCADLFLLADELGDSIQNQDQALADFFTRIANTAFNMGSILFNSSNYAKAAIYLERCIRYTFRNPSFNASDSEAIDKLDKLFTYLYVCRKTNSDWVSALEDFKMCLNACYKQDSNGRTCCGSQIILVHVLDTWIRFKRDVDSSRSSSKKNYIAMTLLDVMDQCNLKLDTHGSWQVLLEELGAFDRRKGTVPKTAVLAVVKQMEKVAAEPLEKGVSFYFKSVEEIDLSVKVSAAKKSIGQLTDLADTLPQAQMYLAMAYIQLYVAQQDLLKKKTEEEMESLGPLIQSNPCADVPQGEDGSQLMSDGTSVDAVSYSYLKLELELKNQELMVKSLRQFEELVQSGWSMEHYSRSVFNCLKSLGYYFRLHGNSFFSVRAWSITLTLAMVASNSEDELITAASELQKCGTVLEPAVVSRCQEVLDKKSAILPLNEVLYHLSVAWTKYNQQAFLESWQILESSKVLASAILTSDPPSKSILVVQSEAYVLQSLLTVVTPELSSISHSMEQAPIQAAYKAAQVGFTAMKYYVANAAEHDWDFYGQEWYVLRIFLNSALHLARLCTYSAAPREARFFIKQALNASQKHVLVIRTAEALLELCAIDLMLDNTVDCRSKLMLICHLMGVSMPIAADSNSNSIRNQVDTTPITPVVIKKGRRKGFNAKTINEIPVSVQQDATNRHLQLPFNHDGTSPSTKVREVSDGIFPQHSIDCQCLTCSSELIGAIRCATFSIQAKLWSIQGFVNESEDEFRKGCHYVQTICSRLRHSKGKKAGVKKLFDLGNSLNTGDAWFEGKTMWFRDTHLAMMELMLELVIHRTSVHQTEKANETIDELQTILFEFFVGPIEHRAMKLTATIKLLQLQLDAVETEPVQQSLSSLENQLDDDVIPEACGREAPGIVPKTPAHSLKRPNEVPIRPKRFFRRNLLDQAADSPITITVQDDDDEGSDKEMNFSRRRLGKPQRAVIYWSDSDEATEADENQKDQLQSADSPVKMVTPSIGKKEEKSTVSSSSRLVSTRKKEDAAKIVRSVKKREEKAPASVAVKESGPKKKDAAVSSSTALARKRAPTRQKVVPKDNSNDGELNARLAAIQIDAEAADVRPKRVTRSSRK